MVFRKISLRDGFRYLEVRFFGFSTLLSHAHTRARARFETDVYSIVVKILLYWKYYLLSVNLFWPNIEFTIILQECEWSKLRQRQNLLEIHLRL